MVRYQEFLTHAESVRACYEDICVEVDGSQTPADVNAAIFSALNATKVAKEKEILVKVEKIDKQPTSSWDFMLFTRLTDYSTQALRKLGYSFLLL